MTEPLPVASSLENAPARRCSAHLLEPVDGAWLAAFRVLFGLTMLVSLLRFIAYGWVDALFVQPRFHFKYWGFQWVGDPSAWQAHALFYTLAALAACVAAGLLFRVASLGFACGFALLQLIDATTYLNHYYLATLLAFLLALSPAGRGWSLDAWIRGRRGGAPALRVRENGAAPPPVARGWLCLFRFQVAVVYTFAGLAKAQPDWLLHAQPLRIWLGSSTDLALIGGLFKLPLAAPLLSWAGFLFDLSIAFWMLNRRARPFAYAAIVAFHLLTWALFPIGMFPVIMVLAALVFFEPSWPRELWSRIASRAPRQERHSQNLLESQPALAVLPPRPVQRPVMAQLALSLGALYCGLSLALPLRGLAYGGDILWHEQGMRWSWRVMVREKNGAVTFHVREPSTNREWSVPPRTYLNALQEREMSGQPDLILQLAHRIRDDAERQLNARVEVRVEALASLNGRRAQALINPSVDLARVEDGVALATWITRLTSEAPPHVRPI